jgi:acetyltransferase-like isoleucine patch superfamily enzyme
MIFSYLKKIVPLNIKWKLKNHLIERKNKNLKLGYKTSVENTLFENYNTISDYVYLNNVSLGSFTYISSNSVIINATIGKYCSIAGNVKCGLGLHPSRTFVSTHPIFFSMLKQAQTTFADKSYFEEYNNTIIGNDVWIGENVMIIGGVTIGDGAIIAAGAVVTKDIPPYAIVGGVPGKVIKYRFDKEEIVFLLRWKWWNLETEIIRKNFLLFHDVKKLMKSNLFEDN